MFEGQTAASFDKLHGLRHAYAQERYRELTGRAAPVGSPLACSRRKKLQDRQARMAISAEPGYGREQITAVYLGR